MTAVEPTKVCASPECQRAGERQPWSNFYPRTRWSDGTTRTPQGYCKRCSQTKLAEWRQANLRRKWQLDRRADENRQRRARGRAGGKRFPSERFATWLHSLAPTPTEIALLTGMDKKHVGQFLAGERKWVAIDTVDRALVQADTHITLNDLYPLQDAA